jgi:sec-independent protein translocase protein TatA
MPNLGPAELLVILAIALIVFGPKKLPEIGKGVGNALREFNKARNDFMDSLQAEPERDEPARSVATSSSSDEDGADRKLEYPDPLDEESADALPYGSDFQAAEGDSQPSFRAADAGATPVLAAATSTFEAITEERKA